MNVNLINKKVLITCREWFVAPDGRQYKAVHGTLTSINTSETTLGFTPSRTHTNWYIQIGNMTIAGCQVVYCVESDSVNFDLVTDYTTERTVQEHFPVTHLKAEEYLRPSYIYDAEVKTASHSPEII